MQVLCPGGGRTPPPFPKGQAVHRDVLPQRAVWGGGNRVTSQGRNLTAPPPPGVTINTSRDASC